MTCLPCMCCCKPTQLDERKPLITENDQQKQERMTFEHLKKVNIIWKNKKDIKIVGLFDFTYTEDSVAALLARMIVKFGKEKIKYEFQLSDETACAAEKLPKKNSIQNQSQRNNETLTECF